MPDFSTLGNLHLPQRPEALQHTFCYKVLIAIHAAIDQYSPGDGSDLDKLIKDIRIHLEQCETHIRTKRRSAAAKKEIDSWCGLISKHALLFGLPEEELFQRWGATIVSADLMLTEAKATCSAWYVGECWDNLFKAVRFLADCIEEDDPNTSDIGTNIYMEVT